MKLTDLDPAFLGAGGEGVYDKDGNPAPRREGVGILLNCPCGNNDENHKLYVPFANPLDGGPSLYGERGWQREGDTFEKLTLSPSILRRDPDGCGWHGFIRNGEIVQA